MMTDRENNEIRNQAALLIALAIEGVYKCEEDELLIESAEQLGKIAQIIAIDDGSSSSEAYKQLTEFEA